MKIAIIGPGGIGTTFALHLARAGHDVTVVARGARLADLQREGAIVTDGGDRVSVSVSAALDESTPFDLVLVTVLASQVDVLLPSLQKSAAQHVMFMFNTFEPFTRLREAVGASRFCFGFPAIVAQVVDGKLTSQVVPRALGFIQITTVTDEKWAAVFREAGIPTRTHADMESWLRTHAAMMVPVMIVATMTHARGAGVTWSEAGAVARSMNEGFDLVESLGNRITPAAMVVTRHTPRVLIQLGMWLLSRARSMRDLGRVAAVESRTLIDAMTAAAPSRCPTLHSLRPE